MAGAAIAYFCLILCLCVSLCQTTGILETSASYNSGDVCDTQDLLTEHKDVSLKCSAFLDENLVEDLTICWVKNQEVLLEYQCVEGLWKYTTPIDRHKRQKRLIFLAILIYCAVSRKCFGSGESAPQNKPPEYKICPKDERVYVANSKQTSYKVIWKEPKAEDEEDGDKLDQTSTYNNGQDFRGHPDGQYYTVTYTATDSGGLKATCSFSFTVKYITCPFRMGLQNGHLASCSHNNIYGSECTYVCYEGYQMVGSGKATCRKDGNWDKILTCQKVICPKPFDLLYGTIDCSDSYNFQSHCLFECDDGFKKVGARQMTCKADKKWSVTNSDVQCKDDEAPEITCSSPKVFYADRGGFSANVTWDEPIAKDNVDSDPVIVQVSGPSQGDVLEEGTYYVTYSASDRQGNKNQCKNSLEVKVVKCSTGPYDALTNSRFLRYNCTDTIFYNGVSCTLECDLNLPLNGSETMSCERDGTTGNGVWVWQSTEEPFCKVVECPPLDPPANGAFTTDSVNARPLHVMLCQKGYDIPAVGSAFQGRLSCQDSGEWYPLPAFPDCIVAVLSLLKLPAELYYEGDCNSNATAEQIKQQVLVYLSGVKADIDQSICPDAETCKIENLDVFCGDTSGRRRRSSVSHKLLKRQSQSNFAFVSWDFVTVFDKGNKTVQDAFLNVLDVFKQLKTKIETDVSSGKLDVEGFTLPSDAFKMDPTPTFTCRPGHMLDVSSVSCKPCPSGTYHNSTTDTCEYCDVGTYVNHDGATVCTTCQTGYSTLSKGSKVKSNCLKLCSPGYFSSTMMEPCTACPIGTYQPLQGQTSCTSCPTGTATNATSSISASDCNAFDIFFGHTSKTTEVGSFNAEDETFLTLSFWLKLSGSEEHLLVISVADTSGSLFNITSSDVISVGSAVSKQAETNRSFSANHWTHVMCTINITTNVIELYIDGTLEAEEKEKSIDLSRRLSRVTVELHYVSKGIYISGLVIHKRPLNATEVSSFSQTCVTEKNDEIFSMTDLLKNNVQGSIIVSPAICDPTDECKTGVCGDHECISTLGGFKCICLGGMTGDLCNVPPDYCLGNSCIHGDCIPGNGIYSCNCSDGFTGIFCDKPPVNGNWSEWQEWSKCTTSCGGGIKERTRKCDNPAPGYMGLDCEGEELAVEPCNKQICPSCPKLERRYGTVVTCTDNLRDNILECNMTCIRGKVLPNGQRPFENYWCGAPTDYQWLPTYKLPECTDLKVPGAFGMQASISYMDSIPEADKENVRKSVEERLSGVGCLKNETCQLTSSFSSESRNKRSISSTLSLRFSISLDEVDRTEIANGTESPAVTAYLNAQEAAIEMMEIIEDNSTGIFDVSVAGEDYTADYSSLSLAATVTCEDGYAGAGGFCAECTAGTKLEFPNCIDCDIGTYQSLPGQKDCLPCPKGYSTPTVGATNISECSVTLGTTVSPTFSTSIADVEVTMKEESDDNEETVIIVVTVVCSIAVLCAVTAIIGYCLRKRYNVRLFRINETKTAKPDAQLEELRLTDVEVSTKSAEPK